MDRKYFGRQDLQEFFGNAGAELRGRVTVFLFGGGAMAFRDQKNATKDLDLIFASEKSYDAFVLAVEKTGFSKPVKVDIEYNGIKFAGGIWDSPSGLRLDLFVKTVLHKLRLSRSVRSRSELLGKFGKLEVRMLSNEDIVLFKAMTDRSDDLRDIAIIARSGGLNFDWGAVLRECKGQSRNKPFLLYLLEKLDQLKETEGIDAPIMKELEKLA